MRPRFQPELVNGPFEDPALYVDLWQERQALLFDLGDLRPLATRKILRLRHIFISHTHMDHFFGFDWLLRVCLGRPKTLDLYGPPGLIGQVAGKLAGYSWNLLHRYEDHLTLTVHEYHPGGGQGLARFGSRDRFQQHTLSVPRCEDGVLLAEQGFQVRTTALDHGIPSLAFALEEAQHVNILKSRLDTLGLPAGPWLTELRQRVQNGAEDSETLLVAGQPWPLGELRRQLVKCSLGHKLGYVVDCANTEANRQAIAELAAGADWLFIESPFAEAEQARALETRHLTARAAGEIGRLARVKQLVPFHFSPRYQPSPSPLIAEAMAAFRQPSAAS